MLAKAAIGFQELDGSAMGFARRHGVRIATADVSQAGITYRRRDRGPEYIYRAYAAA